MLPAFVAFVTQRPAPPVIGSAPVDAPAPMLRRSVRAERTRRVAFTRHVLSWRARPAAHPSMGFRARYLQMLRVEAGGSPAAEAVRSVEARMMLQLVLRAGEPGLRASRRVVLEVRRAAVPSRRGSAWGVCAFLSAALGGALALSVGASDSCRGAVWLSGCGAGVPDALLRGRLRVQSAAGCV